MINQKTIERIDELCDKYKYNWGKSVDFTIVPQWITQEDLVVILERIVDTGESILVGCEKCFDINSKVCILK